jgi:hypothetical protein
LQLCSLSLAWLILGWLILGWRILGRHALAWLAAAGAEINCAGRAFAVRHGCLY